MICLSLGLNYNENDYGNGLFMFIGMVHILTTREPTVKHYC